MLVTLPSDKFPNYHSIILLFLYFFLNYLNIQQTLNIYFILDIEYRMISVTKRLWFIRSHKCTEMQILQPNHHEPKKNKCIDLA